MAEFTLSREQEPVGHPHEPPDEREERKKELLEAAQKILEEFGGQAANIPLSNGYWDLMNEFRALHALPPKTPSKRVTEPYRELSAEALASVDRPAHIARDNQTAMAQYDNQHPAAGAVLQMEIAKENARREEED